MKAKLILNVLLVLGGGLCTAQDLNHESLDREDPIRFGGDYILYQDQKIQLGPRSFFIDGRLTEREAAAHPHVFNSVNEAVLHLKDGTEEDPMVLHLAPWVYWIDDPDDPEIRLPKQIGGSPFGLEIACEWLKFHGLTMKPVNVVLACNRGQTMGAKGNFTMFKITGDGTSAENVTFGNYCNVDLEYPLEPSLGRKKRGSAIVQAQLVYLQGDKITARNTHFISRLNLLPFYGGKRTLFHRCHFESTDDALAPRGVYLDCSFEFYSSKPFGHTSGTGAVFLDCEIESFTRGKQYFVKGSGQMVALDCRMKAAHVDYWGWKQDPGPDSRYYHFNNRMNGQAVEIGLQHPGSTVDLRGRRLLDAYRFFHDGRAYYNSYNLLKGDDDWDPMQIKQVVEDAGLTLGRNLSDLPVRMEITGGRSRIETGKDTLVLRPTLFRSGGFPSEGIDLSWSVKPGQEHLVRLLPDKDGSCIVIPTNEGDETVELTIYADSDYGLEASVTLELAPSFIDPPAFLSGPKIRLEDGRLFADYVLDMDYPDRSLVSWYRCRDAGGSDPVRVAVSRFGEALRSYRLTEDDAGYYLMAAISPAHQRCLPGPPRSDIYPHRIGPKDIKVDSGSYVPDLKAMPTEIQEEIRPGFWTLDCFKPEDTDEYKDWSVDKSRDPWYYGPGINGASKDTGLVQNVKGARIRYTPVEKEYGDMKLSFTACPSKTAGQGFSSAKAQYMDIFIKFDTRELNGYALRLFRTTKYHDAIDCMFMKYENGRATAISEPLSTSCYRTPCFISLEAKEGWLSARMESPAEYHREAGRTGVKESVEMRVRIDPNPFGGTGFQHTGSVGSGATLIRDLEISYY